MTLKQKIDEKITASIPGFQQVPGAVIIHHIQEQTVVYMSPWGLNVLGVTMQELIDMGTDYYTRFFVKEEIEYYVNLIFGLLQRNNDDELVSYFQQVRTKASPDLKLYFTDTRIFMRDDEGQPLLTATLASPIDEEHSVFNKIERLLDENDFLRRNKNLFAALTRREKEIIKQIAIGKNSPEIAKQLSLSEDTVKTHRRNIKRKLSADTYYDIVRFAQAFDLL
jgi:DNA-binding CsgD family transcriptional regulator